MVENEKLGTLRNIIYIELQSYSFSVWGLGAVPKA